MKNWSVENYEWIPFKKMDGNTALCKLDHLFCINANEGNIHFTTKKDMGNEEDACPDVEEGIDALESCELDIVALDVIWSKRVDLDIMVEVLQKYPVKRGDIGIEGKALDLYNSHFSKNKKRQLTEKEYCFVSIYVAFKMKEAKENGKRKRIRSK